jgi:hypothetical protein
VYSKGLSFNRPIKKKKISYLADFQALHFAKHWLDGCHGNNKVYILRSAFTNKKLCVANTKLFGGFQSI